MHVTKKLPTVDSSFRGDVLQRVTSLIPDPGTSQRVRYDARFPPVIGTKRHGCT